MKFEYNHIHAFALSSEELEALLALFTYDLNLIESDQNDVATSGVGMTISDNQQSKPTTG